MGVINLQNTLLNVTGEDLINNHKNKTDKKPFAKILKYEVKRSFIIDAIDNEYEYLQQTINDIRKIRVPSVFIIADKDDWVNYKDYEFIFTNNINQAKPIINVVY